jgi:hypothetical protein
MLPCHDAMPIARHVSFTMAMAYAHMYVCICVGTTGLWVFVFTASKVPELLDTMFLVLRKKPVILLHWYGTLYIPLCAYAMGWLLI